MRTAAHWRTAAYCRLSREDGDKAESDSIANQRKILANYIDDHPELSLAGYYTDDGYTGTNFDRPEFKRLIDDILAGEIDCILVKDLSRPFRNSADQTRFLEETRVRYNVRFISTRLPFIDTYRHPETLNMLSIGFQGMMNENHCRETSLKVRDVFDVNEKGQFIGRLPHTDYG